MSRFTFLLFVVLDFLKYIHGSIFMRICPKAPYIIKEKFDRLNLSN